MELFKYFLFGVSGLSLIFWVCVIALWHTYMFPKFFKEDGIKNFPNSSTPLLKKESIDKGTGLIDRGKYSNQSFVIADFNPIEDSYGVNRLYTSMLISLGAMSFILITYGLHSGFSLYGIT